MFFIHAGMVLTNIRDLFFQGILVKIVAKETVEFKTNTWLTETSIKISIKEIISKDIVEKESEDTILEHDPDRTSTETEMVLKQTTLEVQP